RRAPSVAPYSNRCLLVQVLQSVDDDVVEMIESLACRLRGRKGRVVRDLVMHCGAADGMRLPYRLFTFRRVHDQADFPVLDHVDDVRPPFADLVDPAARNAAAGQRLGRSARGDDLEAALDERPAELDRSGLVAVPNAQECEPRSGQIDARLDLRL